jgi:signal transduction histidine kinase
VSTLTPGPRAGAAFWTRMPRLLRTTTLVIVGLALAVQVVLVVEAGNPVGGWVAFALALAGVLAVRREPALALGLSAAAPVAAALLGWDPVGNWSLACFVAFLLTLQQLPGLLTGVVVAAANLLASGIALGSVVPSVNPGASIAAFAAFVTAAAGSAVRGHARYWAELERRNAQTVATREAVVNRSVAEERVRIARDLHDSIGHQIAVVGMHLGAAEVHLPAAADAARADLDRARSAVQQVLSETQQILRVLRIGAEPGDLAPAPDHTLIPVLVTALRDAGLEIEATLPSSPLALAPAVSTAAYRITQEALTNAQKHGTGTVSLLIEASGRRTVAIEVVNLRTDASARRATGAGHGIIGMRERAAAAGGTLQVRADGGLFWVRAELPGGADAV